MDNLGKKTMQIDELIKALVETKETYGNINVRICDMEDGGHMIEGFDVIDERDERKPKEEYKDVFDLEFLRYEDDRAEKTGRKEMVIWCYP